MPRAGRVTAKRNRVSFEKDENVLKLTTVMGEQL